MNCPHCQAPNIDGARFCGACGQATLATEPAPSASLLEMPSLIGREIAGRYRIQAKLGEGGMGAVFKAEQISLKRTVAVKLLRPEVAESQLLVRRFNAEAEAVAKLSHPNTVNIYDFGQDSDGSLFIAMEYIEGQSLRHVIHREAPFSLRRALSIGLQVASSLTDAHSRSIIHRDLKPDNVMLQQRGRERDIVRVLDFGIAKLRDENRQSQMAMTQAGDMLGTPQYMAPEQIRAETIDGRTDVYALGCLLYEMVTARLPYEAPTIMSLLSKHLMEATVPPSQRRPDLALPPAIDHLILAAMAKDPNVRPPTMEAFADQMAALLATLPADTMQATAQRPAPATPAPVIATPVAYSAIASNDAHPTPTYATHGPQMPPAAFAPPAAPPPASGGPQLTPAPPPVRAGSSSKAPWIILGVLVLIGGGVGIVMAMRTTTPPDPSAENGSGSGSGSGSAAAAGSGSAIAGSASDDWNGSSTVDVKAIKENLGEDDHEEVEDVHAPVPTEHEGSAGDMPAECEEAVRIFEKIGACSLFPEEAREQYGLMADQIRSSASSPQLSPAGRAQIASTCSILATNFKTALAQFKCP